MIRRSLDWSIKRIGAYTLLTFSLLFLALLSVAFGISILVRDSKPDLLLLITTTALLFSWLLARTRFPGWVSGLSLFALGALLTTIWIGDLWGDIVNGFRALYEALWQILAGNEGYSANTDDLRASLDELILRSNALWADLRLWLRALIAAQPVYNYKAISLVWGFVIWSVSAWAGWFQCRRQDPWVAILPAGVILAISLGYTYGAATALFPLIFAALMLAAITFYIQAEQSWKARGMDYPSEERSENIFIVFGITLGILVAAALTPHLSIRWVVETVQDWVNPQVEEIGPLFESFGLEGDLTPLGSLGIAMQVGLPRAHLIGSGPELTDQIVMSVRLEDDLDELNKLAVPLYWRGITYDRYTGLGWESSDVLLREYTAEESAIQPGEEGYRFLYQDFNFVESHGLIYAAGDIVSLDTDYNIAWRLIPGITETLKTPGDFFAGSQDRSAYRVVSVVPLVPEAELRAADDLYPSWVVARYLQLPNDIPQRVIDLARQLTQYASTHYEKARAIEAHLRAYEYELNLPAPPQNRELSDYFLFELQKGYCDYYATAMVVLARAVGVPSRIATGYTQGDYDPERGSFIVAEDNAHTWVEVYFTGIGWVAFEPTAGQPALQHPAGPVDLPTELEPLIDSSPQVSFWDRFPERWPYWLLVSLLGLAFFFLVWPYLDCLYLRYLAPARMVARLYKRIFRLSNRIGSPTRPGDTPYEFAIALGKHIHALSKNSRLDSYLHSAGNELQSLTDVYVRSIYSPHPLLGDDSRRTISAWRRLRVRLILAGILYTWQHSVRHE